MFQRFAGQHRFLPDQTHPFPMIGSRAGARSAKEVIPGPWGSLGRTKVWWVIKSARKRLGTNISFCMGILISFYMKILILSFNLQIFL